MRLATGGRRSLGATIRSALLAALVVVGGLAASAGVACADYDVSNTWVVQLPDGRTCSWVFVQNGVALQAHGACGPTSSGDFAGTIDPQAGTLEGNGEVTKVSVSFPTQHLSFTLSGVVAPAGSSMSGTLSGQLAGPFTASLCQNGNLDPGEQCDEGVTFDGCCTATCQLAADGTTCSTNQCQSATTCSAGACIGTPKSAGTLCDRDGNTCTIDTCDAAGACVAGPCSPCCGGVDCTPQARFSCTDSGNNRSSVQLKSLPGGKTDRFNFTIPRPGSIAPAELGDPTTTTDYDVCVFFLDQDLGAQFVAGARAPAGQTCGTKPCWRRFSNGTVTYQNPKLGPEGLASLTVKPGNFGVARVRVVGRGPNLPLPQKLGPVPGGELLVDVRNANSCWSAFFLLNSEPRALNTATELKGKRGGGF